LGWSQRAARSGTTLGTSPASLQTQLSAAQRAAHVVASGTWSIVTQYRALPRAGAPLSGGLFAAVGTDQISASNKAMNSDAFISESLAPDRAEIKIGYYKSRHQTMYKNITREKPYYQKTAT
jgi:hypothetical protein